MPVLDTSIPPELGLKLLKFERHLRRLALLRGLGIAAVVGCCAIGGVLLVDALWNPGPAIRSCVLAVATILTGWTAWRVLVQPSWRWIGNDELASLVDAAHPELSDRISSTVEVSHDRFAQTYSSPMLRGRLVDEAVVEAGTLEFDRAISPTSTFRWLLIGGFAVAALVLPFAGWPDSYGLLWARMFLPWGNFETAGRLSFRLDDGDRVVLRGTDVTIEAELTARVGRVDGPQQVQVTWWQADRLPHTRRMLHSPDSGLYELTLSRVIESFDFRLSTGEHESKTYAVDVVDAPQLRELALEVTPLAYTRLPAYQLDGALGETKVPEQSRLRFRVKFNKAMTAAQLRWLNRPVDSQETRFTLAPDRRSAELLMTAVASGPYSLQMQDADGFEATAGQARSMFVVSDEPPALIVENATKGPPQRVSPFDTLPVDVLASDDYGVAELELHYETSDLRSGVLKADEASLGGPSVEFTFEIAPAALGLVDGSTLTYRIRAADERPVPAPNETWSQPQVVLVDSDAQTLTDVALAEQQRAFRDVLKKLRERVANDRADVEELQRQASEGFSLDSQSSRREDLSRLAADVLSLSRGTEQLATAFERFPLYSDLTDDLQQVSRESLAPASEELGAAAQLDMIQQADAVGESHDLLKQAEGRLIDIEQRFDELIEIENDLLELSRLAQAAEQLAGETRDLRQLDAAASRRTTGDQAAVADAIDKRYEQLQAQQQSLSEDLGDLLERRPELIEAALGEIRDRLLAIARQLNDLARPQQQLAASHRRASQADSSPGVQDELPADDADPKSAAKNILATQQQLTGEASRLALEVMQSFGPDDPRAQLALNWVRAASRAAEWVLAGQYDQAADVGSKSFKLADELAQELRQLERDDDGSDVLLTARALASAQTELNKDLRRLAPHSATRREARFLGQLQLIRASGALAGQLDDVWDQLRNPPLERIPAARETKSAQESAQRAQGLMQLAQQDHSDNRIAQAGRRARNASESLQDAARHAEEAARRIGAQDSPIPGEVGEQVTQAAQQLADAQEQLAQSRSKSSQPENQDGENQQASSESGEGDAPGQGDSQAQDRSLGQSASKLQQASESLSQAAQQMQHNRAGQQGAGNKSGSAAQADGASESPGDEATAGGTGARADVDLRELESELRKQALRSWGELPGTLKTEILQSARKTPRSDYARLIKLYFEEIARPQSPTR